MIKTNDKNILPVIVIAGPTASGKSALALDLAEEFGGWVINGDSMQVYRDLHILTARPDAVDEARVPHRLFGVLAPDDNCSVARWLSMVAVEVKAARAVGKLPIVVGGTGLYLRVMMEGLAALPEIPSHVRERAENLFDKVGGKAFHAELAKLDEEAASKLPASDRQRLIRAYEVIVATGKSLHDWQREAHKPSPVSGPFVQIALTPSREGLYEGINARFDTMVEMGALEEVEILLQKKLDPMLPSMKAVGVRELGDYIGGKHSLEAAKDAAKQSSRRYAKRQLTWIKNQFEAANCYSAKYSESLKPKIFSFIRQNLLTKHP